MRILWFASIALVLAPHLCAQPVTASAVVNATGYQTKLAPGTIFVIFGSGMGPASLTSASAPNFPTVLAGTSVTFTPVSGGPAITAKMVYTISGQVAGLLDSSVAPGAYAVRVTYNNQTSAPVNVTVVARSFGIATANSSGSGTAQATIGNVNGGISLVRFTSGSVAFAGFNWALTPARPGDTLVLWGTGGGADPANDTGGTSGDQTAAGNFVVIIAGRRITPLYAGASSGFPGLWQVNFTLPLDIEPDCFASVQVSAGGELGNLAFIPIAAPGQTACSDPDLDPEVLAKLDTGERVNNAVFGIYRVRQTARNITQELATGWFGRLSAAAFAVSVSRLRFGYCYVYDQTYPITGQPPGTPEAFLDAGSALPLSGPNVPPGSGLARLTGPFGASYLYQPSRPFETGLYTMVGNGGTHVGPFSVSTSFPASFTVTNWDTITAIDRRRALTFNWAGSGFAFVNILVTTNVVLGSNRHLVNVLCERVPASPGTYSVPPEALAYLTPGNATMAVHGLNQTKFTPPLTGGGRVDFGAFAALLGMEKEVLVQQ